jgi:mutator protein MutT
MRREYPDTPLVGVGAIIIEGDRVLLVKRGKAPMSGEWSIPGGALELGETLRQAAVREVLEEAGLLVEPADLLGVYDRVVRDAEDRVLYHYVLVDFLCRSAGGDLQAAGDAADARWFKKRELSDLSLAKDTAEVIQLGFEKAAIFSAE